MRLSTIITRSRPALRPFFSSDGLPRSPPQHSIVAFGFRLEGSSHGQRRNFSKVPPRRIEGVGASRTAAALACRGEWHLSRTAHGARSHMSSPVKVSHIRGERNRVQSTQARREPLHSCPQDPCATSQYPSDCVKVVFSSSGTLLWAAVFTSMCVW